MNPRCLDVLRCPKSKQRLHWTPVFSGGCSGESGWLVSEDGRFRYPVTGNVPRFVDSSNYADSFGLQWNRFRTTQLDSHSGHPISAERFWAASGWSPAELSGKWVLDAGCGAGRFAEVALRAGAVVVALDYSNAVDACYANLNEYDRLHVVQGDIYSLPFCEGAFDFVYSLGVLQHLPDVRRAVLALPSMLAMNGRLCVDFYSRSFRSMLLPKYALRPVTTRMCPTRLLAILEVVVPKLLPVSVLLGRIPRVGRMLRRAVPVANYVGDLPLSREQHLEWSLLDTFDALTPQYDHPQTKETVKRWLDAAGLQDVEVFKAGNVIGRGRSPQIHPQRIDRSLGCR